MESLEWECVSETTVKNYWGRRNICMKERKAQGKGPWLHDLAEPYRSSARYCNSWHAGVLCLTISSRR